MIVSCVNYNSIKDIQPVEPFGFISLVDAFNNSCIPAGIEDSSDSYNDIEDPSTIVGKPSDVFEAMRMADALHQPSSVKTESAQ